MSCSSMNRSSTSTGENSSCANGRISQRNISLRVVIPWAVAYSLLALLVLLGNSLVVLSFIKKKRLRTRTNYFIVSLSVTDWFVGAISLPWWIYLTFVSSQGQTWFTLLHEIWVVFDILGGVGSILHLVALSWDRLCAIVWPLIHRTYSKRRYVCVLCFIWACAVVVAGCSPRGRAHAQTEYNILVIILFFFVPLVIICVAQAVIFTKIRRRSTLGSFRRSLRLEGRVTKTISVMIGLFMIGWLPFSILSLLAYTSPEVASTPWQAIYIVKFLQYGNSAVNPALYAHNFPHFRNSYTAVLGPCREIGKSARNLAVNARMSFNRRAIRDNVCQKSPAQEPSRAAPTINDGLYPSTSAVVQADIELKQTNYYVI